MSKDEQILKALERFESKFDNKIDRLDARLDAVEKVQIKQEANLGEHMYRTTLAEKNHDMLRVEFKTFQNDIKPVQTHVAYMNGALKALGIIATIIAIAAGVVKIVEFIF